mmetsp:Transcript_7800/g.15233  ORF Transcript_7800/g.15233 Transcript_7800/m.15233 type:complete len:281 (-) Transcript_7800:582-1424(-)
MHPIWIFLDLSLRHSPPVSPLPHFALLPPSPSCSPSPALPLPLPLPPFPFPPVPPPLYSRRHLPHLPRPHHPQCQFEQKCFLSSWALLLLPLLPPPPPPLLHCPPPPPSLPRHESSYQPHARRRRPWLRLLWWLLPSSLLPPPYHSQPPPPPLPWRPRQLGECPLSRPFCTSKSQFPGPRILISIAAAPRRRQKQTKRRTRCPPCRRSRPTWSGWPGLTSRPCSGAADSSWRGAAPARSFLDPWIYTTAGHVHRGLGRRCRIAPGHARAGARPRGSSRTE